METSMAPDDRDHTFQKALERHLRPDRINDATPDAQDEADAPHPGAEILASYHERLLAPEQMILWKSHIAGCERCQQVLAHLEATDDLLVEDTLEEAHAQHVLAMPDRELPEPAAVPAASPARAADRWSRRFKVRSGANWRWLAPAGALAAGLLLWISFHEANAPSFQLAKNQHMTAPSAVPAALPATPSPANKEVASSANATPLVESSARGNRESEALRRNESIPLDEKRSASVKADKSGAPHTQPSPPHSDAEGEHDGRRSNVPGGVVAEEAELQKQKQATTSALSSTAATTEFKDQRADSLDTATNQVKSENFAKAKAASGAAGRQAPQDQNTPVAQPAPGQPLQAAQDITKLPVGQDATKHIADIRNMRLSDVAIIPAPGGTVLWSAGPAGIVRHSTDAGATWAVQASGVVADLLAGSAPSDKVCWIVGRFATILRTADSGAHWQKIRAPITDDLLAVFAVDAQQASISLAQATYQTKDGGRTWTKLLPE
jgi:hypothetical protein